MSQAKVCTKCNIEKLISEFHKKISGKYGVDSICNICKSNNNRVYRNKNKELISINKKLYYDNNQAKIKHYREINKEKKAKLWQEWYKKNKIQRLEYYKKYRKTAKGKAVKKANTQNRRAAKRNNGGSHTAKDILNLFELQGGKCPYCKCKLYKTSDNKYHIDHIVPLSKCGNNDISNLQLLCPKCNISKQNKSAEEFAANFNQLF